MNVLGSGNKHDSFLRITSTSLVTYFGLRQQALLFIPREIGLPAIKHPSKYKELADYNVQEVPLVTEDKINIFCWDKNAIAASQPHYLLFHGNSYHWGDVTNKFAPSNSRLRFLEEIAKTGAGFSAVSLRGYGKSNGHPSEEGFKRDISAVLEHVCSTYPNRRIIVAGESMGTANAAIAAEQLTVKYDKPPAILGMVNPFASMVLQVEDVVTAHRISRIAHLLPCTPLRDQITAVLNHPFNTMDRVRRIRPETRIYIATSQQDEMVHPRHSDLIRQAATETGLEVEQHLFAANHCGWPITEVATDLQILFRKMQSAERKDPSAAMAR